VKSNAAEKASLDENLVKIVCGDAHNFVLS